MLASPLALTSRAVYVPNRPADSRARVEPRTTATMRRRFAAAAARRAVSMARGALVGECRASRLAGTSTVALACAARSIAGASASPRARFAPRARAPSVPFARRGLAAVASPDTRAPPAAVGNGATDVAFADLDLCAETLRALHEVKGFERATAVQGQTLPHILGGADVLARAKTDDGAASFAFASARVVASSEDTASAFPGWHFGFVEALALDDGYEPLEEARVLKVATKANIAVLELGKRLGDAARANDDAEASEALGAMRALELEDAFPTQQQLMGVLRNVEDGPPTVSEFLDVYDAALDVDLDSENVWPAPPPLRF